MKNSILNIENKNWFDCEKKFEILDSESIKFKKRVFNVIGIIN